MGDDAPDWLPRLGPPSFGPGAWDTRMKDARIPPPSYDEHGRRPRRPGEVLALTWRDLTKTEIRVRQSLSTAGELKLPKDGKVRTVSPALGRVASDSVTTAADDGRWIWRGPAARQDLRVGTVLGWVTVVVSVTLDLLSTTSGRTSGLLTLLGLAIVLGANAWAWLDARRHPELVRELLQRQAEQRDDASWRE